MTLDDFSKSGTIVWLCPKLLAEFGYSQPIIGVHPYLVFEVAAKDGMTQSRVIPLSSKGSRADAVRIPTEYLRGPSKFVSRPCFLYSLGYAMWIPAWVLLEATSPGPDAQYNGHRLTPDGVDFVLRKVR